MPVVTPNFSILNNAAGSVSSAIANAASSFAMGVTDSIGTGAQVIGSAIDDMGTKATAVLNSTTGKITELGNYLSQDIVGKLQSELSQFTANFGGALRDAPRRMLDFIKNTFSGLGGSNGALTRLARLATIPAHIAKGGGLFNRYDNRTGRYHNVLTNRMVSMSTGRNQSGGLMGNITARVHEFLSNIGKRLMDAFKELENAVGMILSPIWERIKEAARSLGKVIAEFFSGIWETVQPFLQVGIKATTGKIGELGNYLSQGVIGGLRGELSRFTENFGAALHDAPRRMMDFIKSAFGGMNGGSGLLAHLLKAPRRILKGEGIGSSLVNRFDNRTLRYHNIFTNQFATMRDGSKERGGLAGKIKANIHRVLSNIHGSIMGVFDNIKSAISGVFEGIGKRIVGGVKALGKVIADFFVGIWETVQPFLQAGLKAAVSAVKSVLTAVPELIIPIVLTLGVAIGAAIKAVITRVVSAITSAWGAITSFVSSAWTVVVTGVKNFFGFIGNLFNSARGAVSGASGLGSIIAASVKVLLSNMFQLITGALQIGVAGVAMGVFAKAVYEAAKSAQEFAKSALALQSSSGRSFGQSAALQFGGRILGISPESLQNAYGGNAAITAMKGRAFGVDPTNLASVAGRFQQLNSGGMGSQMMAQAMLKTLGMDSTDFRQALMQRPSDITSQQGFQQNLLSGMGIGQSSLEKFATEVPLLFGRIGAAWDAMKIKLATTALPMLENLGKAITDLAVNNADKIAAGIQTVAEWMFVKAPVMMAQGLVSVADIVVKAVNWMIQAGRFLEKNISNVFRMIGETIGRWMDALGNLLESVGTDKNNPLRGFVIMIGKALDAIRDMAQRLFDAISSSPAAVALGFGNPAAEISNQLQSIPSMGNMAKRWMDSSPFQGAAGLSHSAADQARNIGDGIAGWLDKTNPFGKGTDFLENTIKPAADAMNEAAIAFQKGVGSESQRQEQWNNEMLQQAKEQTASLKDLAKQGRAPETSDRTASYMLMRYAKESTVALRRQGA